MFSVLGGQNSFKSGRGSPLPCAPWLRAYEGSKQSAKKLQDIICNHTPNFDITFGGSTASASIWFLDNFLIAHHIIFSNISQLSSEFFSYTFLYRFCLYFLGILQCIPLAFFALFKHIPMLIFISTLFSYFFSSSDDALH